MDNASDSDSEDCRFDSGRAGQPLSGFNALPICGSVFLCLPPKNLGDKWKKASSVALRLVLGSFSAVIFLEFPLRKFILLRKTVKLRAEGFREDMQFLLIKRMVISNNK